MYRLRISVKITDVEMAWRAYFVTSPFAILNAQKLKPERSVKANVIDSTSSPRLQIRLPNEADYVGSDRWLMYGAADCEVHVFVEADNHKVVQRLYWIQFEGYVPSRPELKYDYSSNPVQKFGGVEFYVRSRFGPTNDAVKPGSDAEHVRLLIGGSSYTMPGGMMNVRLVHLPDEQRRRELMIIYAENTKSEGVEWEDLMPGGKAADRWPDIQRALIERAAKKIVVTQ